MAQRDFVYDLIAEQPGGTRKEVWQQHSSLAEPDNKQGRFVELNASKYAIKALSGVFTAATLQRSGAVMPIYVGNESPDAKGNSLVTTLVGTHRAKTNGYHADPTALSPVRAAWGATLHQPLVVVDGKLAPYLAGTDADFAIWGHLVATADSEGMIEVQAH